MHKVTFFPIGNADCCRIDLANGQQLLFDYCHRRDEGNMLDKRIDLFKVLRDDLKQAGKTSYEVVAITHLDDDHIHGAKDFFYFRHCKDHQENDRTKIDTLWVPAAVIVEDECDGEASLVQEEARYRLRQKEGIRVFSRPTVLQTWLEAQGMTIAEVSHLIIDAGQFVPGWTKDNQGVEFFVHSPFATRLNEDEVVDRNKDSLFLQATFRISETETRLILSADVDSDVIEDIVKMTRDVKRRPERLGWDINNVPHHSSFRSLNKDDKGEDKVVPPEKVDWLYHQGGHGGYLVSTSKSIPVNDDDAQPPHRQAANYYKEQAKAIAGEYPVTMEHPNVSKPDQMIFEVTASGAKLKKPSSYSGLSLVTGSAPRAGLR